MFTFQRKQKSMNMSALTQKFQVNKAAHSYHPCSCGLFVFVENLAFCVGQRHAEKPVKQVFIDHLEYEMQVKPIDLFTCMASINYAWKNTMEVGICVIVDDFHTLEQRKVLKGYITLALQEQDQGLIPSIVPETAVQKKRYLAAQKRRLARRARDGFGVHKS